MVSHKVASLNLSWDEFPLVSKKISLAVLAAKLGSLGHGLGFEEFFRGRVKPCCFLLMKNAGVWAAGGWLTWCLTFSLVFLRRLISTARS